MLRKLIYLMLLLTLYLTAQPGFGQTQFTAEDILSMVKNAPTLQEYPQAGAIILLEQKEITVNTDGSSQTDLHLVIKLLTDRGKEQYGDQKFKYDSDDDSLVVLLARTFKADLSTMAVEEKAINDITPPELANATVYSNLKQKVISFPALAPNTTIELKLRKLSKAPEDPKDRHYWGIELFQTNNPILYKEVVLKTPATWEPQYVLLNQLQAPEISNEPPLKKYVWKVENEAQIIEEPNMPPFAEIAPKLIYTSAQAWNDVGQWFGEKFYAQVQLNDAIQQQAKELTKNAQTVEDKIRQIFLYVVNDIRAVYLNLGEAGYEPNPAPAVLENRYGDMRDKAVILVALLKAAGIEAYPAMLATYPVELARSIPTPKQFNALFVVVPQGNDKKLLWLNPFAERCRFGYFPYGQGNRALVVKPDQAELMPVMDVPAEENRAFRKLVIDLDEQGNVTGNIQCELDGYFDFMTRRRLKYATPKEKIQFFQQAANAIGEGTLEKTHNLSDLTNLTEPTKLTQDFETPELGVVEGDMMIFRIPDIPYSFAEIDFWPVLEKRNYNFYTSTDCFIQTEGVLNIPKNFKIAYLPKMLKLKNEFGEFQLQFKSHQKDSKITFESSILIKSTKISKDKYATLKSVFDAFGVPKNQLILLERKS